MKSVVIVGAGPAGSSLALGLVGRGIDPHCITLVDARRLLGRQLLPSKVCGDAMAAHTLAQLSRLGVADFAVDEVGSYRAHGVIIAAPNGVTLRGRFKQADMVMARADFDGWIAAAVRAAGVRLLDGWRVRGVERAGVGWWVNCQSPGGRTKLAADYLVGADGATSLVARAIGVVERRGLSVAVRGYLTTDDALLNDDNLYLHFLDAASGYGWYFQMRGGAYRVNVGIGTTAVALRDLGGGVTLRTMLDDYLQQLIAEQKVRVGAQLADISAWQLPMSGQIGKVIGDNALLIGDAAGLVSPLTGAGIENAVDSALLAADVLAEAMQQPERAAAAFARYSRRLRWVVGRHLRRDLVLRRIGDNRAAFSAFAQIAHRFPALTQGLIYAFK